MPPAPWSPFENVGTCCFKAQGTQAVVKPFTATGFSDLTSTRGVFTLQVQVHLAVAMHLKSMPDSCAVHSTATRVWPTGRCPYRQPTRLL